MIRSDVGRRLAKIASMSADELRVRVRQAATQRWDAIRCRLAAPPIPRLEADGTRRPASFFFTPDQVPELVGILRARLPQDVEAIIERADRICAHRFDLLGHEELDYGQEIDWHLDAVSGRRAPLRPWHRIDLGDFDRIGDAKVTWELNRHQHWVTLAKAYRLSGNERYAVEIEAQWEHWWARNPYSSGINWASALEVAFRSLSWLWVKHLLAGTPALSDELAGRVDVGLACNGRHLETYLSTYSSPNTHLLGEAVALFFIGVLVPRITASERWQRRAWRIVEEEAVHQVLADGMHFEKSLYYHVYAVDLFLHARILAQRNAIPVSDELERSLAAQLEALGALGQTGTALTFGDDDGGRVFDGRRNRAEHLLDPLATGAALLQRGDFKALAGEVREETVWLLGADGVRRFDEATEVPTVPRARAFAPSGLYLMGTPEPTPCSLLISAGRFGRPAGGHSHADLLSVQLALRDRTVLGDSGTFSYNAPDNARGFFRGTGAHNTLRVGARDQAEPAGPFAWVSLPEATVDLWIADDGFGLFRGAHDAYSRPGAPATHCRWVFQLARGLAIVRDVVSGSGARRLELAWHLPARARIEATGPCADAVMVEGRPLLVILVPEGHGWEKATDEGWESPAYGQRTARPVLRFSRVTTLPAELVTVLDPGAAAAGLRGRLYAMPAASVETDEARVAAYRYDDDHAEHMVFYAAGAGSWRFSDFESDAEFLYCKLDRPTKRMARAIVVGGSRVAWRGKLFTPRDAAGEVWTWRQPMATATADGAAIPETHRERGP